MSGSDIWSRFDDILFRFRFPIGSVLLGILLIGGGVMLLRGEKVVTSPVSSPETSTEKEPAVAGVSTQINVNTADQAVLETLPGIGPTKAKAIVDFRDKNGPFKKIDDLLDVPGIGEKTLAGIRDQIQVK
jgi:competence protein ComEA